MVHFSVSVIVLFTQIYSYSGKLTYSIRYDIPKDEVSAVLTKKPDIVMKVRSLRANTTVSAERKEM